MTSQRWRNSKMAVGQSSDLGGVVCPKLVVMWRQCATCLPLSLFAHGIAVEKENFPMTQLACSWHSFFGPPDAMGQRQVFCLRAESLHMGVLRMRMEALKKGQRSFFHIKIFYYLHLFILELDSDGDLFIMSFLARLCSGQMDKKSTCVNNSAGTANSSNSDEYEEQIMVLQLNGVLDFEAVKRAAQTGTIRVRESNTDSPLIQIGSSLYSGEWTQTAGTDLIFCINDENSRHKDPTFVSNIGSWDAAANKPQLDLVAISDMRLSANKVLLTTEDVHSTNETEVSQQQQQEFGG